MKREMAPEGQERREGDGPDEDRGDPALAAGADESPGAEDQGEGTDVDRVGERWIDLRHNNGGDNTISLIRSLPSW